MNFYQDAAGGGAQCNQIAVAAFSTLLAAPGPCEQQNSADNMIDLAKTLNSDPDMIKFAQIFAQQPRNSVRFFHLIFSRRSHRPQKSNHSPLPRASHTASPHLAMPNWPVFSSANGRVMIRKLLLAVLSWVGVAPFHLACLLPFPLRVLVLRIPLALSLMELSSWIPRRTLA
jgi:hypothetical protein